MIEEVFLWRGIMLYSKVYAEEEDALDHGITAWNKKQECFAIFSFFTQA